MVTGTGNSPPPQKPWPTTPISKPPSGKPTPPPGPAKSRSASPLAPVLNLPSSPVLAPEPAAEEIPWETLASDTANQAAFLDTGANSVRRVLQASTEKAKAQERRRIGWIAGIISAVALVALAFGFWKFFTRQTGPSHQERRLKVTKDASVANSFRSVARALEEARSGDTIELYDEEHFESLNVDRQRPATGVTIQAAQGKNVVWKPSEKQEHRALISLSNAKFFVLKGSGIRLDGTIDGKRRLNNLVTIYSDCPGLTLKDVEFHSFSQAAVVIMNCQGEEGRPVRLVNLRAAFTDKKQAGVFFNADPSKYNDYIDIDPDNFPGVDPGQAFQLKDNDSSVNGKHVNWPGKKN